MATRVSSYNAQRRINQLKALVSKHNEIAIEFEKETEGVDDLTAEQKRRRKSIRRNLSRYVSELNQIEACLDRLPIGGVNK